MPDLLLAKIAEIFPELPKSRTLLAVSAGIDSVVMAHLFATAHWPFGIAHCNFRMRGADSEGDESFVRSLAEQWQVPFYTIAFDTQKEAEMAGVSIQMVARSLRYAWLEDIRKQHHFGYLATAHHLNDSLETSLINQTRGTGLRGILGIPARQGMIIRPMMGFTRSELADYAQQYNIAFREDSSNPKDDYHRNRIRHHVIPVLKSINPALENTFQKNLKIWSESVYLLDWACRQLYAEYVRETAMDIRIDVRFIADHPEACLSLLYEWLKPFHFHSDQLNQAIESVGRNPGAVWYSPTHRLLLDREALIVEQILSSDLTDQVYSLNQVGASLPLPDGELSARLQLEKPDLKVSASKWEVYLDADRIDFPLSIRHWQPGDSFCPLGMLGNHKKVQDFFTDEKVNRFDKEKIWLLLAANGDILWIVGHRIDERYKIRDESKKILALKLAQD